MADKLHTVSVRFDDAHLGKIDKMAKRQNRSRANLIESLVLDAVKAAAIKPVAGGDVSRTRSPRQDGATTLKEWGRRIGKVS